MTCSNIYAPVILWFCGFLAPCNEGFVVMRLDRRYLSLHIYFPCYGSILRLTVLLRNWVRPSANIPAAVQTLLLQSFPMHPLGSQFICITFLWCFMSRGFVFLLLCVPLIRSVLCFLTILFWSIARTSNISDHLIPLKSIRCNHPFPAN